MLEPRLSKTSHEIIAMGWELVPYRWLAQFPSGCILLQRQSLEPVQTTPDCIDEVLQARDDMKPQGLHHGGISDCVQVTSHFQNFRNGILYYCLLGACNCSTFRQMTAV